MNKDKFDEMWFQQRLFVDLLIQSRGFRKYPLDVSSKDGQQFLEMIAFRSMKELFEALEHFRNSKEHREQEIATFDREGFIEEMSDVLHFFVEILIYAGIDRDEFYNAYISKGEKNVERIKGGYLQRNL